MKCEINFAREPSKVLTLMNYVRASFRSFNKRKKRGINKSVVIGSGIDKNFSLKGIAFAKKDTGQGYIVITHKFI